MSDEKENQQIADERRPFIFQLHEEERRKMNKLAERVTCGRDEETLRRTAKDSGP